MTADEIHDAQPAAPAVRLPLSKPLVTSLLLGGIGIMFVVETITGGSNSSRVLTNLGAQINSLVAAGQYWRLLAAMFLHIGLMHVAFNGWALFSIGRDVEALYGSVHFTTLYLLSGLAGNVAYYCLGPDGLSAGASGAIFGLIGAEAAFFLSNRSLFGKFGRQRLLNLVTLIGINVVFGFTVPGINNIAHLGGLVGGFLLGLALAPRYRFDWTYADGQGTPVGVFTDTMPRPLRWLALGAAIVVLLGGLWVGHRRWADSPLLLRQQAQLAAGADDLARAQALLERAVTLDAADPASHYALGLILAQRGNHDGAAASLEVALRLSPGWSDAELILGLVYAQQGRTPEARTMLERFLAQEDQGQRAAYARQVLDSLPK